MRELDRVQVGERPEAVEGHARDRSEREEAACVQRLASRAPLRLALHAPQRMVQRGAELAEDEAAVPLGREAANQPPDRQVERRVLLHREQDLGLDLRLAAVLLDGSDDLDGDGALLGGVPHLDDAAEGALAELRDDAVPATVELVADAQHVVPLRALLPLLRVSRRRGRARAGPLLAVVATAVVVGAGALAVVVPAHGAPAHAVVSAHKRVRAAPGGRCE